MITVGVIGAGYWGPNLIRNFATLPQCQLKVVCDQDRQVLDRLRPLYPQLYLSLDWREVLSWPEIQAVVIASPTSTHYEMALEALKKGKDVFVEKPLASTGRRRKNSPLRPSAGIES